MHPPWRAAGVLVLVLTLGACGRPAPAPAPIPEVGVVTAQARSLAITRSYPGRMAATLTAQVPARITGNILKRVYREGTNVKAGQVLFLIDPAPLEASLRIAEGQLAQAVATARNASSNARRSRVLGAKGVLAKQDVDNAIAASEEAAAAVKTARATVQNARISLGYATVTAPIAGRAGRANVTQGALVSPTDTTPLTTIQVVNPIYANFSEPMAEVERLRQAERAGQLRLAAPDKVQVQIVLPDGNVYPHPGTLDFTDLAVDPSTGAVNLRALVPNPDDTLLPGMFVTIRLTLGTLRKVFLLPQTAIQRDVRGAFVFTVDAGDRIAEKRVTLGAERGSNWVVTSGLSDGERVVVSGVQKASAGERVKPVTQVAPATASVAAASG